MWNKIKSAQERKNTFRIKKRVMDSGICIDDRFGCSGEYRRSCR